MNVSAKTEYACIAMLELAASYDTDEPVRIRSIADSHGIPSRFLVQILLQLKGAGLVNSTRGAAGGYQLSRDPAEISLAEVMAIIDGQPGPVVSSAGLKTPLTRALLEAWDTASSAQQEALSGVTLSELLERARNRSGNMYYI